MRINWDKKLPEAFEAMLAVQIVVDKSSIDHKLLELIKVRASQINGCAHCLEMHTKDAIAFGENEQRLHLLAAWWEAPLYSDKERAALAWCESLTIISSLGAPANLYEELNKCFTAKEIVELTLAIIAINSWNRLAVAFKSDVGNYVSNKIHGELKLI